MESSEVLGKLEVGWLIGYSRETVSGAMYSSWVSKFSVSSDVIESVTNFVFFSTPTIKLEKKFSWNF